MAETTETSLVAVSATDHLALLDSIEQTYRKGTLTYRDCLLETGRLAHEYVLLRGSEVERREAVKEVAAHIKVGRDYVNRLIACYWIKKLLDDATSQPSHSHLRGMVSLVRRDARTGEWGLRKGVDLAEARKIYAAKIRCGKSAEQEARYLVTEYLERLKVDKWGGFTKRGKPIVRKHKKPQVELFIQGLSYGAARDTAEAIAEILAKHKEPKLVAIHVAGLLSMDIQLALLDALMQQRGKKAKAV